MAIAAYLDEVAAVGGRNRARRRALRLAVAGRTAAGESANVTVHNASATGLLIESREPLAEGEELDIDLPEAGLTRSRIVWASGALYGCEFEHPISTATLSAAELRSAVGESPDLPARGEPNLGEAFGLRLQRLRKARGLTMAQVAEELGVSKPTVWAWEHGKARPVDERLVPLATVLGTNPSELEPGSGTASLLETVRDSRQRIADEAGTTPDRVRIMIEL